MGQVKKLIEVALPLEAINAASAREKSIRHGHPSTLHLWWARRPLAAARAVLFTSLVDDPNDPEAPKEYVDACRALPAGHYSDAQDTPRGRLFDFIETLVQWENSNNEEVLETARRMIHLCTDGNPPPVYDPFAGGGTIPLEAQRLGLEAHASDLNPVSVLINKAMIEIPPKFAAKPPVNPEVSHDLIGREWEGAQGLAEDVRYYGKWMRDEAFKRIGHLYPKVQLPQTQGGGEATVIAWIWARTVPSPNPGLQNVHVPLVSSFWLSKKKGKEAWVEPVVEGSSYRFVVRHGAPNDPSPVNAGTKLSKGAHFRCLISGTPIQPDHVYRMGKAGRMGTRLMAIVAEGIKGRVYLALDATMEDVASKAVPAWRPDGDMPKNPRWFSPPMYGLDSYADLFTPRQLVSLNTFSDLVGEAREKALEDARKAGLADDAVGIADGGSGARAYADAVATYLGMLVDKLADLGNALNRWEPNAECPRQLFARQAIPMVWDFAEANPFSGSSGSFAVLMDNLHRSMGAPLFNFTRPKPGSAQLADAQGGIATSNHLGLFSTDPPYYDNIGYADLSDFFYVWLRRSLKSVYPAEFGTLLVPKTEELVATPYRFEGDKSKAKSFFEVGLQQVFERFGTQQDSRWPLTVYYAFKQTESKLFGTGEQGSVSTGWETMLSGLIASGFQITGTWPIRTEMGSRMVGQNTNALASSIVLSCRKREQISTSTTRGQFIHELREALEGAVSRLTAANTPPVDLDQSAIGPGMGVFSKYARVMEGSGTMTVRSALALINQTIEEILTGSDADYDSYTRWAISWFQQYGFTEGAFGDAETLSKAKDVSVSGLTEAGFLHAKAGKVRILKRQELDSEWDPQSDERLTVWEITHYLIRNLEKGGEEGASRLLAKVSSQADSVKELCYRLFSICEKNGWAQEALGYNMLISSWPEIARLAAELPAAREGEFDFG